MIFNTAPSSIAKVFWLRTPSISAVFFTLIVSEFMLPLCFPPIEAILEYIFPYLPKYYLKCHLSNYSIRFQKAGNSIFHIFLSNIPKKLAWCCFCKRNLIHFDTIWYIWKTLINRWYLSILFRKGNFISPLYHKGKLPLFEWLTEEYVKK